MRNAGIIHLSNNPWDSSLRCPVGAHWGCLAVSQRDEVLKAAKQRDLEQWEIARANGDDSTAPPKKRRELAVDQTTEFICGEPISLRYPLSCIDLLTGACMRGGICMGCMDIALQPDASRAKALKKTPESDSEDVVMEDGTSSLELQDSLHSLAKELLFRCFTCKRLAHYRHLITPSALDGDNEPDLSEIAEYYQNSKNWLCSDCSSYRYGLDKIIAWRPYPANAVEPARGPREVPDHKSPLPREYLVKWTGRSYRRIQWVPHMWLLSTHPAKLKYFLANGTKVELLTEPIESQEAPMDIEEGIPPTLFEKPDLTRASSVRLDEGTSGFVALPDAELRIPLPWKTVDRILDVLVWRQTPVKSKRRLKNKQKKLVLTSDEEEEDDVDEERKLVFEKGEQPPVHLTESFQEWNNHSTLKKKDIDQIAWAFIKWDDLGYDESLFISL